MVLNKMNQIKNKDMNTSKMKKTKTEILSYVIKIFVSIKLCSHVKCMKCWDFLRYIYLNSSSK